jgi:hypothetical protein
MCIIPATTGQSAASQAGEVLRHLEEQDGALRPHARRLIENLNCVFEQERSFVPEHFVAWIHAHAADLDMLHDQIAQIRDLLHLLEGAS